MVPGGAIEGAATLGDAARSVSEPAGFRDRRVGRWIADRSSPLLIATLTAGLFVVPVVYVFSRAFTDDAAGIRAMLDNPRFTQTLISTLQLSIGSTIIAVIFGSTLAWCAHCLPVGRRWLGFIPMMPLVVPHLAVVIGFAFLLSPSTGYFNSFLRTIPPFRGGADGPIDVYTVPWMILVFGLTMSSFVFLFVRSSLAQLHQDVIDAAAVCGASKPAVFFRVVLPLIRPALTYGGLTVMLLGLGQFTIPLILGRREGISVLTTQIYYETSIYPRDYRVGSAYGLPILTLGLVFLVVQRVALRNQDRFVSSVGRGARPLTSNGWVAQSALILYGIFAVVLPLLALGVVALQPFWSENIVASDFSFEHVRTVLEREDLVNAIKNSVAFAMGTVLFTLPLGFFVARTIHHRRHHPWVAAIQELIVSLPLGIPSVVFGIGFLFVYLESPVTLYDQPLGMILLYTTIMIPYSTRLQLVAMVSLGEDLSNAASVNGAGWLRRMVRIELPLLRPALGGAAALIVVVATHEFSASMLVRGQKTQVIGTVLYDLWNFGSYSQTAVMALVMCGVTGAGVAVALLLGGRSALGEVGSGV